MYANINFNYCVQHTKCCGKINLHLLETKVHRTKSLLKQFGQSVGYKDVDVNLYATQRQTKNDDSYKLRFAMPANMSLIFLRNITTSSKLKRISIKRKLHASFSNKT